MTMIQRSSIPSYQHMVIIVRLHLSKNYRPADYRLESTVTEVRDSVEFIGRGDDQIAPRFDNGSRQLALSG
jgi:hypothetical protein